MSFVFAHVLGNFKLLISSVYFWIYIRASHVNLSVRVFCCEIFSCELVNCLLKEGLYQFFFSLKFLCRSLKKIISPFWARQHSTSTPPSYTHTHTIRLYSHNNFGVSRLTKLQFLLLHLLKFANIKQYARNIPVIWKHPTNLLLPASVPPLSKHRQFQWPVQEIVKTFEVWL